MTIQIDQIEALLTARRYHVIHRTSKKCGFQLGSQLPIYLNLTSKTGSTALIAHPESGLEALRHKVLDLEVSNSYFHSSNMRHFPKRMHTGENPISNGWGLTFTSLLALEACLNHLEGRGDSLPAGSPMRLSPEIIDQPLPVGSDMPAMSQRRIGHEQFRLALIRHWDTCAVTGLVTQRLLRASHIKPWSSSTSTEKTDPFNGLLLSPHLDAAFDAGLITFDDQGQLVLSDELSSQDAECLGIHANMKLRQIDSRHRPYLAFHRQEIFVS